MSESKSSIVRTRFAPSPSGHLHVGGARTALFCWAYAKAHGGSFILRIEDTDQKRSSDAATRALMEDLAWLGIRWNEGPAHDGCGGGENGPYLASQRLDLYHRYIDILLEQGKAYRAFEGREQLEAARATARAEKRVYRYDRAALKLEQATIQHYLDEGRPHVVRFKVPDEQPVIVHDKVYGEVTVRPQEIDDFVILKGDGYPTYHFAVVVDDELMGVTHVIRGQEHLYNTAKHVLLQDALGFRRPVYAHLSLIFNPDGSKMSKRDKDKALRNAVRDRRLERSPAMPHASNEAVMSEEHWQSWLSNKDHPLELESAERLALALDVDLPEIDVKDFRRAGYLPEVMVNYLALLGWSPGGDIEKFDQQFLIEHFDLDRVIKSPARFDRDKLLAFNLDALQAMSTEQFTDRLRQHGESYHPEYGRELSDDQFAMFAAANHQRSKMLDDPFRSGRFCIMNDDQIVHE
ncbi:MAG: glutamate--tRNA ligase, partial [Planctomycetes bacterium]|nr:glutamate--tRNA ligase [Planctomycetota bacterium]